MAAGSGRGRARRRTGRRPLRPPSIAAGRVKEKRSPSAPARTHAAGEGDGFRTGARHGRRRPRRPRPETGGGCSGPRPSVAAAGGARAIRGPDGPREPRSPVPRPRSAEPRWPGRNGPAASAPTYGAGCVRLPHGHRAARNPGALRQGHRGWKAVARPRRSSLSSFLPYNLSGSAGGEGGRRGPPLGPPREPCLREQGRPRPAFGPEARACGRRRQSAAGPLRVPRTRRVGGTIHGDTGRPKGKRRTAPL